MTMSQMEASNGYDEVSLPSYITGVFEGEELDSLKSFMGELLQVDTQTLHGLHINAAANFSVAAGVADAVTSELEGTRVNVQLESRLKEEYVRRMQEITAMLLGADQQEKDVVKYYVLHRRCQMQAELLIVEKILESRRSV